VTDSLASHDRPADLVLARVHLRLGSLSLARAELETLAGRDALDEDGLVDLAEARWRTGDIEGAGEAARAALHDDDGPLLALVVAAEAAAARGRPTEARRLASKAMAVADGAIDGIFAGMPRGAAWPPDPAAPPPAPTTMFGPSHAGARGVARPARRPAAPVEPVGSGTAAAHGEPAGGAGDASSMGLWEEQTAGGEGDGASEPGGAREEGALGTADAAEVGAHTEVGTHGTAAADAPIGTPADTEPADAEIGTHAEAGARADIESAADTVVEVGLPDASAALVLGRRALEGGTITEAAWSLGLALRLDPGVAPRIIELVGDRTEPGLAFVRGDAYRLVGRERDALRAYADAAPPVAAGHAAPGPDSETFAATSSDALAVPEPDPETFAGATSHALADAAPEPDPDPFAGDQPTDAFADGGPTDDHPPEGDRA
jgi:hypothetical protein